MRILFFVFAVLSALVYCTQGEGASSELSVLSAKFQSLINELGERTVTTNDYKEELSSLLSKLQRIQSHTIENRTISLEWFGSSNTAETTSMRIILVVSSFEGVYLNSGIGTFYSALSDFLISHGHSVTVLYTNNDKSEAAEKLFSKWKETSQKRGVSVVKLDPLPVHVTSPSLTQRSYQVYQYLKKHQQDFDVVHFPDWEGPGYFALLAKHQGLSFSTKILVVGLHGPTRWVKHANQDSTIIDVSQLEVDWLEKNSVEMADIIVTPSVDLPQWLISQGWILPDSKNIFMMPFLPGREIIRINKKERVASSDKSAKVKELVFFGRLESRKGLIVFADALDVLAQRIETPIRQVKITFLGRGTNIDGQPASAYLDERAQKGAWPFRVKYIAHKDRRGSLDYLLEKGQDRVAVMPSLVDNAPYTVYECLYTHIPFVASNLPSIAALVHPDDRESVLFKPTAEDFAAKLREIVEGEVLVARSSISIAHATGSWEAFYNVVDTKVHQLTPSVNQGAYVLPKVSVCIPYFNRPHLLPLALQSIRDQDYPSEKIEVVLVDDGSTDIEAIRYVDGLKDDFDAREWQIVRTENKYLGAARNTAARTARGEYLLFLDDDNIGKRNQISTYVSVARTTHADIITAAHDVFKGSELPDESPFDSNIVSRSVPLGPAVSVGVFKNCFGDANFFVQREAFMESGGFTEERGVGQEDYEYLAKAVLAGRKLEAIPEVLLYYRMHSNPSDQMLFNTNPTENQVRSFRPYVSLLDGDTETGDVMKVMAHRRVELLARSDGVVCNLTSLAVDKSTFPASQATVLTFTAGSIDCNVTTVRIGSFLCSNLVITGRKSFSCLAPPIPFPNKYGVSLTYAQSDEVDMTGLVVTVTKPVSQNNTAILIVEFIAGTKYTLDKLFNLFAQLVNRDPSLFSLIDDITSQLTQRRSVAASGVQHNLRFAITTPSNESATDIATLLVSVVFRNLAPFTLIDVTILDFNLQGGCQNASCLCTPNWYGSDCAEKAACLNDCTGNGDCVDGPFGRVCNCYLGYIGRDCSFRGCPLQCSGHGTCHVAVERNGTCTCDFGWSGSGCEQDRPCPDNCNGLGTCQQGVCLCVSGRGGPNCLGLADTIEDNTPLATSDSAATNGLIAAVVIVGVLFFTVIGLSAYVYRLRHRR